MDVRMGVKEVGFLAPFNHPFVHYSNKMFYKMRPQEFLALLLDTLHEELKAENTDQVRSTFLLNSSFHFNENRDRAVCLCL